MQGKWHIPARWLLAGLAGLSLLAACASVSPEECLAGDWGAIGQRDGAAGRVADTQFDRHVDACARVDVTPDRAAWAAGYAAGLRQYCTPSRGLDEGAAGRPYRGVCPAPAEAQFLRGHDLGLAAHRQRQRISDIQREISSLRRSPLPRGSDPDDAAARRIWQANQTEINFLRLEQMTARAELARIEREIRAFRAAL